MNRRIIAQSIGDCEERSEGSREGRLWGIIERVRLAMARAVLR